MYTCLFSRQTQPYLNVDERCFGKKSAGLSDSEKERKSAIYSVWNDDLQSMMNRRYSSAWLGSG